MMIALYDDWSTGDIVQSLFFSPAEYGLGRIIGGIGPAMLLPSASEKILGADQWGLGPTTVVLKQMNGWTFEALANHIWVVEHKDYTEATYDWKSEDATVPINLMATKIVNLNGQLISVRYWTDDTTGSAKEWGCPLNCRFHFPEIILHKNC